MPFFFKFFSSFYDHLYSGYDVVFFTMRPVSNYMFFIEEWSSAARKRNECALLMIVRL